MPKLLARRYSKDGVYPTSQHDTQVPYDIRYPVLHVICSLLVPCFAFISVSLYNILHFHPIAFCFILLYIGVLYLLYTN